MSEHGRLGFDFPKTACLLIHGFGGSPFEMEPLVPELEALGCHIDLPTLPGHGTTIAEFRRTFFQDWLACAEERFIKLTENNDLVIPIGFSMGASIALILAARYQAFAHVQAAVALAPAYDLYRFLPLKRLAFRLSASLLQYIRPVLPIPVSGQESRDMAPYKGYEGYLCLPQMVSLGKGLSTMRSLLSNLSCPLLMMFEVRDSICRPEAALYIAQSISSANVSVHLLRMAENVTSHHMLTTHRDTREKVASETADFVRQAIIGHRC